MCDPGGPPGSRTSRRHTGVHSDPAVPTVETSAWRRAPSARAGRYREAGGWGERRVRRVISLGAKTRNGGPQKPVPRLV